MCLRFVKKKRKEKKNPTTTTFQHRVLQPLGEVVTLLLILSVRKTVFGLGQFPLNPLQTPLLLLRITVGLLLQPLRHSVLTQKHCIVTLTSPIYQAPFPHGLFSTQFQHDMQRSEFELEESVAEPYSFSWLTSRSLRPLRSLQASRLVVFSICAPRARSMEPKPVTQTYWTWLENEKMHAQFILKIQKIKWTVAQK